MREKKEIKSIRWRERIKNEKKGKLDGIKNMKNQKKWYREAIKAVMEFREACWDLFIQNWNSSREVGRINNEQTA